jgi:cytochrome b561
MTKQPQYRTTAKLFHWAIVALLLVQLPIACLMPDIHRGMTPGSAMTLLVSIGIVVLGLIVMCFAWHPKHPVSPESSLPVWQRTSEGAHWLFRALVLVTTLSGWLFASIRAFIFRRPTLTAAASLATISGTRGACIKRSMLSLHGKFTAQVAQVMVPFLACDR